MKLSPFFVIAGLMSLGQLTLAQDEPNNVPPPSSAAQQLYATAQHDLLQLRVLLKNGDSQSSVGSGFLIGNSNLVVTNYHVVSQIALEPETYVGQYKATDGSSGSIELLAVDVLHDLAIVRVDRTGNGFFQVPSTGPLAALDQGERLYSLGNPLDLGFTITEGTYNGISSRGFSDQLMFTGPVNPGMSGGPNITAEGQLAGVNVAHRRDGELVSFLVPARYVQALLAKVNQPAEEGEYKAPDNFEAVIGEQLLQHQDIMVNKLLETPFTLKRLGNYQVPVRESDQVRCWGGSNNSNKTYSSASIHCSMESEVFVSGDLQTGHITLRHKYIHSKTLNAMQFSRLISGEYSGQVYSTAKSDTITPAACYENFVRTNQLPVRALVCSEAYHKFAGLYDFTLITSSNNQNDKNLQSMINILGVSYANGTRLINAFLAGLDTADSKPLDEAITDKNSAAAAEELAQ